MVIENIEIERKYLLLGNAWKNETIEKTYNIKQYYPETALFVEVSGDEATLFLESNDKRSKPYWSIDISVEDAKEMLQHCCSEVADQEEPLRLFKLKKKPRLRMQTDKDTAEVVFFLTIKQGLTDVTCAEWEYEIDKDLYMDTKLRNLATLFIDKDRSYVNVDGFVFHVDEFLKNNTVEEELVEAETKSEDEFVPQPEWLGKEVTGDRDYYNKAIAKRLGCKEVMSLKQ